MFKKIINLARYFNMANFKIKLIKNPVKNKAGIVLKPKHNIAKALLIGFVKFKVIKTAP